MTWRGSVHIPELPTEANKRRSQPTRGRPQWCLKRQKQGAERTADRLHILWSRADIPACRSAAQTMAQARHSYDRGHAVQQMNNAECRNASGNSLGAHEQRRGCKTHQQRDRSECNLPDATRNHMSRGQRTSQQAMAAKVVGPSRACSFLKARDSSGRPVAERHYVDDTIIVKKIAGDS